MKSKNTYIILVISILLGTSILLMIGLSYAYFNTEVKGEGKNIVLETGDLKLRYTDDSSMSLNNALPGDSIVRTFKVENIGFKKVSYNILWNNLINTINNYDLQIDMKCKSYNSNTLEESGTCDSFYKAVPYSEISTSKSIKKDIEIDTNITQEYTVTITFKNRSYNQNDNLNKSFSGRIDLEEYIDPSPDPIYCTFDGELVQGAEYVNGQYTYRYKQQYNNSGWNNINDDGWGVTLTDKTSTDSVTSKLCTYINNKPVVSMLYMFSGSGATSIDLSSFNTTNVIDMSHMFSNSQVTKIDLSNFDTSNVTSMNRMFWGSKATTIDGLENFDTSNVTDMSYMFSDTVVTILDLSNFDTSNVIHMHQMFMNSQATTLDLSSFNTNKVTDMSGMFQGSQTTVFDLSSFNTSNVTDMCSMFSGSAVKALDLHNFDTSNVTNMSYMFQSCQVIELDVSSFDTSNVTNMSEMFWGSKATEIDVSNFDTSKVTNMSSMFSNSKVASLNLNNFDTSNVTSMGYMFQFVKATTLDLSSFDTSKVTNMIEMFGYSALLKTIYVSDKFNTDTVIDSTKMFTSCPSLVGGNGTKYNLNNIDKTYARIDTASTPGYFTSK